MDEAWLEQFPLRARGARLVNRHGERFKLAGVNWYGASDSKHVVGGLDVRPLKEICRSVAAMGFTVVRLPFSNQMLRVREVPEGAISHELNPDLKGLTPLDVYDRVVDALGEAGVAVVLNNHTTVGLWSGGVEPNGLWFQRPRRGWCCRRSPRRRARSHVAQAPGAAGGHSAEDVADAAGEYSHERWVQDWLALAERYGSRPHVIGYDLRNEVRPASILRRGSWPRWGSGGEYDWSRACGECARALAASHPGLVIVERICWPQRGLQEMLAPVPPWDAWGVPRDRIVLSLHSYSWSGPGYWSPKAFVGGVVKAALQAIDGVASRALYGELAEQQLVELMAKEWGRCLDEDLCPVWLSEFGADSRSRYDTLWFGRFCRYLERMDADFAYWPLNVGPKPGGEGDESYGLLTNDWRPCWSDERLQTLQRLVPREGGGRGRARGRETPWGQHAHEDEVAKLPLAMLSYPWCAPLPGPLVPWPDGSPPKLGQLPECRYVWLNVEDSDADEGQDACIEAFSGDVGPLQKLCVARGYGGFALRGGKAYVRSASADVLRSRMRRGCTGTTLWIVDAVVLCACLADAPADSAAADLLRLQAEADRAGLEPPRMPLAPEAEEACGERQESRERAHLVEDATVKLAFEAHVGQDCFLGSDALVLPGASLASCRELCLSRGFGGFALRRGTAYFRTAAADALRQRLAPAAATTFYILTATRGDADLHARLFGSAPPKRPERGAPTSPGSCLPGAVENRPQG